MTDEMKAAGEGNFIFSKLNNCELVFSITLQ